MSGNHQPQWWLEIWACFRLSFLSFHWLRSTLQWRYNRRDGVSNYQPHDCLLNRLFRHRSQKNSKAPHHWPCEGNSSVTGEFPAQRASNAENVSIWWRHHEVLILLVPEHQQHWVKSTSWVLMPWIIGSQGRRQSWYWLQNMPGALFSMSYEEGFHLPALSKRGKSTENWNVSTYS